MFVLTLAETIKALKPPPCNVKLGEKCEKPTSKEVGFFWLALVFVAISFGGTAPTRAALAVDQFDETVPRERPMLLSFSRRWLLCLSCSALVAQSGIVYVQESAPWQSTDLHSPSAGSRYPEPQGSHHSLAQKLHFSSSRQPGKQRNLQTHTFSKVTWLTSIT
jgi:hypothetical protein